MFNAKEEKERQEELSQVPAEVGRFQALGIPNTLPPKHQCSLRACPCSRRDPIYKHPKIPSCSCDSRLGQNQAISTRLTEWNFVPPLLKALNWARKIPVPCLGSIPDVQMKQLDWQGCRNRR